MKAFILAVFLTFTVGCATAAPRWYVSQGFTLSECGPAVAAMADRWATGSNTTRFQTRAFNKQGVNAWRWWNMKTIQSYLESQNVKVSWARTSNRMPNSSVMGIFNVGKHFVVAVSLDNGSVRVADPMLGSYMQDTQEFLRGTVGGGYLLVIR